MWTEPYHGAGEEHGACTHAFVYHIGNFVWSHTGHKGGCITVGEECPHLTKHMNGYCKVFATVTMS